MGGLTFSVFIYIIYMFCKGCIRCIKETKWPCCKSEDLKKYRQQIKKACENCSA